MFHVELPRGLRKRLRVVSRSEDAEMAPAMLIPAASLAINDAFAAKELAEIYAANAAMPTQDGRDASSLSTC